MRAHAIDSDRSSSAGFPSDTNLLIDACIATVRQAARLDDDAVLPPLPKVAPRRGVVIFTKSETASAARSGRTADDVVDVTDIAILEDDVAPAGSARSARKDTSPRRRRHGARSRWAVALCALVASTFGTAAFLRSPAGRAPAVVRATSSARAHATAAVHATAALFVR